MNIKFLKHSWLHPIHAGYEEDREEDDEGFMLE